MILEESEKPNGERIATIRSNRNTEHLVNMDKAAMEMVNLFADSEALIRQGWILNVGWYEDRINEIKTKVMEGA